MAQVLNGTKESIEAIKQIREGFAELMAAAETWETVVGPIYFGAKGLWDIGKGTSSLIEAIQKAVEGTKELKRRLDEQNKKPSRRVLSAAFELAAAKHVNANPTDATSLLGTGLVAPQFVPGASPPRVADPEAEILSRKRIVALLIVRRTSAMCTRPGGD